METEKKQATIRRPAVAGTFYPGDKGELERMADGFFKNLPSEGSDRVWAVIVPHAGYVFSGATAATAFAAINPDKTYKRIFLLGPSHCVGFDGAAVDIDDDIYATPLGSVTVDTSTGNRLIEAAPAVFKNRPDAHTDEHCLEVQLPLLQRHLHKMPPIVPIVIGTQNGRKLRLTAEALRPYFDGSNLFVISSDFSHYPSYTDAQKADSLTGKAIENNSLEQFVDAIESNAEAGYPQLCTSACGQCAIAVLLMLTEERSDLHVEHLHYCNSGDSPYGGHDRVVGYHSFAVVEREGSGDKATFALTDSEKHTLLSIARKSIANVLAGTPERHGYEGEELTADLKSVCGAFVTLNEGGRLRGCIGNLVGRGPLYELVDEMARSAAFEDPRFSPVAAGEMSHIQIEVSVLSPLRRISSIDEFVLGRDGIFMTKDGRSGTFLPQVADEVNWTKEEFLAHCSHDKAGLGWDGWKSADLYVYEAVVFSEGDNHADRRE